MSVAQSNLRSLFRFDCIITIAGGILLLAVPALLKDMLQLGSMPIFWMRIIGAVWLAFGLWLAVIWNREYTKGIAIENAIILAINADILILAAIFGGFSMGILGWISMLGTAAFITFVAWHWWRLSKQL